MLVSDTYALRGIIAMHRDVSGIITVKYILEANRECVTLQAYVNLECFLLFMAVWLQGYPFIVLRYVDVFLCEIFML